MKQHVMCGMTQFACGGTSQIASTREFPSSTSRCHIHSGLWIVLAKQLLTQFAYHLIFGMSNHECIIVSLKGIKQHDK